MVCAAGSLILPAGSVWVRERFVSPSGMAVTSAFVTGMLHVPSFWTVVVFPPANVCSARVMVMVAPGSPVPVMLNPASASLALMRLSPVTWSSVGALGGVVSSALTFVFASVRSAEVILFEKKTVLPVSFASERPSCRVFAAASPSGSSLPSKSARNQSSAD